MHSNGLHYSWDFTVLEQSRSNNVGPRIPDWLLRAQIVKPNIPRSTVINRPHWEDVSFGLDQCKERQVFPKRRVEGVLEIHRREPLSYFSSASLKSNIARLQHAPIPEKGIYRRILAREISEYHRHRRFPDSAFGSTTVVGLHRNSVDFVSDAEMLFRPKDLHRIQIGFSNRSGRICLVRPELDRMPVKFLLRCIQQSSRRSYVLAAVTNFLWRNLSRRRVAHFSGNAESLAGGREAIGHVAKGEG